MIEVEQLADGEYRYWSSTSDVIAHNQSGHVNSYSPDGKWLGLLEGGKWHLVRRRDPTIFEIIHPRAWEGATNNVLQWSAETPDSRLLRIRGSRVNIIDPHVPGIVLASIDLPRVEPPGNWDWMNWRSGDSTNQRLLHVWFGAGRNTDASVGHFTLCIIDTEKAEIVNTYPFDEDVHLGSSTQPRWHHCFGCGDYLMVSLSGWGPAGNPHYSFTKANGIGWSQRSYRTPKDPAFPVTLPWSHVAYHNENTFVVYGYDNRIQFTNWFDGSLITQFFVPRERMAGYGHGCVAGTMIAYSLHDWQKGADAEVWLWDTVLNEHTKIADLSGLKRIPGDTSSRARPQLAWDGSEVGWHELRDVKGFVSFRTKKIEKPKPPVSDLERQYQVVRTELDKLGEEIRLAFF